MTIQRWRLDGQTVVDHEGKPIATVVDPEQAAAIVRVPEMRAACEQLASPGRHGVFNAITIATQVMSELGKL